MEISELPKGESYFKWLRNLKRSSTLEKLVLEYYSDEQEHIYTAQAGGNTFTYCIGTHPQLLYPHFTNEGVIENGSPVTDINEDAISQLARQTAYNKGELDSYTEEDQEKYIWNSGTYLVTGGKQDATSSSFTFEISESDFYTVASKNAELGHELISAVLQDHFVGSPQIDASSVLSEDLPLRDRYLSGIMDNILNAGEFPLGVGGTYLTLLRSEDGYYLVTGDRSSDVFVWPEMHSVIPSGFFQISDISTGNPIRNNLLYTYSKEFFDDSNPNLSTHSVRSLNQFIDSGNAEFHVTGSGIELVYGNYQITGLLMINYQDYVKFIQDHSKRSFEHDSINIIKLSKLNTLLDEFADSNNISPTSGFALFNGLHYLQNNTDISVPFDVEIQQFQSEHPTRLSESSTSTLSDSESQQDDSTEDIEDTEDIEFSFGE